MDWLYPILDMVVIEQVSPSCWHPRAPAPGWFHWPGGPIEELCEEFAFLDYFVPEARRLSGEQGRTRVRSEIWTQTGEAGQETAFRAEAIFGDRPTLVIQRVNEEAAEIRALHQWGKDWALASQRLDQHRERVELIGRRKDEFLASMSHELRTPLNSIVGFATLLDQRKGGDLSPRQGGFIANILTASRHLLALINELLDIAKVDAGRLDLQRELFRAEDCASEVLTVLTPQASGKGIRIETRGAGVRVFADRLRLKQILYNLLSNAIKFSPAGECVTISFEETTPAACLTVSNRGPGIAPAEQAALFERFQRPRDAHHEGTGLGLAITKRLVDAHGGAITVESPAGQGARFRVSLPYPPDWSTRDGLPADLPLAIAVIEGEPGTGLLIRSILEPEHQVKVYSTWAEARAGLAANPPDLVFMDHELTEAGSREVLHHIREVAALPATRVAVLVRDAAAGLDELSREFTDVIHKPLGDGRVIRDCVMQAVAHRGAAR